MEKHNNNFRDPEKKVRLIDANRTEEQVKISNKPAWMVVRDMPTVDAVEVVHGRWKDVKETSLYVPDMKYTVTHTAETCSVCNVRIGFIGSKLYLYDNICPNCGAKMDGGNKDGICKED